MGPKSRLITGALAAILLLGACGGESSSSGDRFRRGIGADPKSLDPQKVEGTWANDIVGDMFIGLFTEDEASKPIPGVAESWTVSDDKLTWTFKLKQMNWSDGEPVTADDFVFAFQRLFDPKTVGVAYASIQFGIKNSRAVNDGSLPVDQVGVKAIDDHTLEIQLEYPMPYLPGVLKHYTAFPLPRHVLEKFGDKWTDPANIVVNGPYKVAEWRKGDFLLSKKNEGFEGADKLCFSEVVYFPTTNHDQMVRRAMAGEIDMNNSFPTGQLEETKKNLPGWPRISPMMATTYVVTNTKKPPFDDASVDDPFVVTRTTPAGRFVVQVLYTGHDKDGVTAIGLAARYGDEGPLDRQSLPVYSIGSLTQERGAQLEGRGLGSKRRRPSSLSSTQQA